jgi:hypothetical protein
MKAQEFYEAYESQKEKIKEETEKLDKLIEDFIVDHQVDGEYKIKVEDKTKYVRVYTPEGRFVYNKLKDVGVRAKPENVVTEE